MKTILAIFPLLLILPVGYGIPVSNKTKSEEDVGQDRLKLDNSQGSWHGERKSTGSQPSKDETHSAISTGQSEGYLSIPSTSDFPSSITQESGSETGFSYIPRENSDGTSEYSAPWPYWLIDEIYDNAADVSEDNYAGDDDTTSRDIESALIAEKLEPLYQSISHLKELLSDLTGRESKGVSDVSESTLSEGHDSGYSSSEDWYPSSTSEESTSEQKEPKGYHGGSSQGTIKGAESGEDPKSPQNDTYKNMRKNGLESSMMNAPEKGEGGLLPGRRVKRDLGWGLSNDFDVSFSSAADDFSSVLGSLGSESSWSSSLENADESRQWRFPNAYSKFLYRIKDKPKQKFLKFLPIDGRLYSPITRLDRRRRNRNDYREFIESLPTLEGMRKRTGTSVASDGLPFVPNSTPPPVPANLPPPNNVIHPFLRPEDAVPDLLPEEDNQFLEEQTNGIDLPNQYHDYYETLKDLERSIMMEPVERLASQLAGPPSPPEGMSERFRRVIQVPPPPPYGRKVVKSLYRKKAADYGFPFGEAEFSRPQPPMPWNVPVVNEFNAQENEFNIGDQYPTPHKWGQYVQFGQVGDLDNPDEMEGFRRYLAGKLLGAEQGSPFVNSNGPLDSPRPTDRELLLQALLNEVKPTDIDQLSSSEDGNQEWGAFEPDQLNPETGDSDEAISTFKEEDSDGEWESQSAPGDQDVFSESLASNSDISDADWGDAMNGDEIKAQIEANIPSAIEAVKHHLLVQKLAQIIRQASKDDK